MFGFGKGKAPVADPRKTMGAILGHAVRFGVPTEQMIIGEGIETMLSLRACLPACLSRPVRRPRTWQLSCSRRV